LVVKQMKSIIPVKESMSG